MKPIDIIIIVAAVLAVGGIIFYLIWSKKKGKNVGCGCDCSSCGGGCGSCSSAAKKSEDQKEDCCPHCHKETKKEKDEENV